MIYNHANQADPPSYTLLTLNLVDTCLSECGIAVDDEMMTVKLNGWRRMPMNVK